MGEKLHVANPSLKSVFLALFTPSTGFTREPWGNLCNDEAFQQHAASGKSKLGESYAEEQEFNQWII